MSNVSKRPFGILRKKIRHQRTLSLPIRSEAMADINRHLESANLDRLMRLIEQPKSAFSADDSFHRQVNSFTDLGMIALRDAVYAARSKWQDALGDNIVALHERQAALEVEIQKISLKLQQDPGWEQDRLGLICQLVLARWEFEAQAKKLRGEGSTG